MPRLLLHEAELQAPRATGYGFGLRLFLDDRVWEIIACAVVISCGMAVTLASVNRLAEYREREAGWAGCCSLSPPTPGPTRTTHS